MGTVSISGFNSPFNTDKVIQELLRIERRPIRRLERRIGQAKSTQDVFKTLNNKASSLQEATDSLLSPSTFNQKKASSGDSSFFTATVNDNDTASTGTFDVTVNNLAKKASVTSGQFINDQKLISSGTGDTSISNELVEGSGKVDLDSSEFLDQLSKDIETTGAGDSDIGIDVNPGTPGGQIRFDFDSSDGTTFTEEDVDTGETVTVFGVDNFQQMIDTVESQLGSQIKMEFNSTTDSFRFVPQEQNGNGGSDFELTDDPGDAAPPMPDGGPGEALTDDSKGFFQQIGINSNLDVTFDTQQSNAAIAPGFSQAQNLLSVSGDQTFGSGILFTSDLDTTGQIQINNTTIDFDSDSSTDAVSSINELVDRINDEVEGVTAKFNQTTDKVILETENTGSGSIDVEDSGGDLANVLNLRTENPAVDGQDEGVDQAGEDSEINFDGDIINDSDNTVKVDGVTLNLKKEDPGTTVDLTVEEDTESITSNVQKFVDKFNGLVEFINKKSKERAPSEVDGEGDPSDSGALLGEGTSRLIKSRISDIVTDRFQEATSSGTEIDDLSDVGIELNNPINASDTTRGTLKFDSEKFKEALDQNPDQVKELFTAKEGDASRGGNQNGVSVQLNNFLEDATGNDGIITSRIDGFDDRVQRLNERIDEQEERVQEKRGRLERQFRQMEQMLASLQQQQSFLSARL